LPHVLSSKISSKIGNSTEHAIDYLKTAIAIMEERYSLFEIERVTNLAEYNSKTNQGLCRHLIVLDEYADIISKEELRNDLENLLEKLSQKARAAGIHLIITTQKPSAKVLSTVIRSNLPAQLALKVSRIEDSRIILGDNSGAKKLNGKGDALFNNGNGTPIRLQVANS
jgi:DNA segregation ATPase FtsK/SpoIIIE-like protein